MEKYRTIQGDTWDRIARRFYGDERYLDLLMEGNPECLEYLIFPAGVELLGPEKPGAGSMELPPWRR